MTPASKTRTIGFDFLTLADSAWGTSDYLVQTLMALRKVLPDSKFVIAASRAFGDRHGKQLRELTPVETHFIDLPASFVLRSYAQQVFASAFWFWKDVDLVHSVGYAPPVAMPGKKILNLHRRSLRLPDWVLGPMLYSASRIFVESPLLLDEIRTRFPKLSPRVSVLPPGVSSPSRIPIEASNEELRELGEKFFLHVGSLDQKLRIHQIMESFSRVAHRPRFKKMSLVFLASSQDDPEDFSQLSRRYSLTNRVTFIPHQTRPDFLYLLNKAEALIYSGSALEVPPVVFQAVAFQKPVLLSMDPEDLAHFDFAEALIPFQFNNPKDLAEKLTLALSDTTLRKWLSEYSEKFLHQHSWEALAQIVAQTYRELDPDPLSPAAATVI